MDYITVTQAIHVLRIALVNERTEGGRQQIRAAIEILEGQAARLPEGDEGEG